MKKLLFVILIVGLLGTIAWMLLVKYDGSPRSETSHQLLVDRIEAMGKLELVKYKLSDVVEHKTISTFLPDASVLLIVKADAVGCIDLTKLNPDKISVQGDSVSLQLPSPEICYIKIDHSGSRVYDTKMAFFREAALVDEAFKSAERQVEKEVAKSDILLQTKNNAMHVFRPLLEGLGFKRINLTFE
ncbi:DUF4230 domain-containing protein [Sphingobacterium griseoflavum]|uniref:DUF4230 domain-containing protein n=1 Tax=Sphingobacterium griseoflavum TaxID=1474952 RepID=A0ABQ3HWR5_9SPHI|nr:DUF4230 domain-containing protein [Sphingobacterium griseoflavum]GHE42318.1 hypothetical protein GCM10017764_26990 [Sphingobacterium griseoflavum]